MPAETKTFDEWFVRSSYQDFVRREEAPMYEGSALENLATLELADWKRRGGKVAYTRLGDQEVHNLQIVEIPPGGELKPEHHMYDSLMFVMKGRGASAIWQESERKTMLEWQEGSLLALPLNAWHQEFNGSGDEPCRMVFGTTMPEIINRFHSLDFVFNCNYQFKDRFNASMQDFYGWEGEHRNLRLFETHFISDVNKFKLDQFKERGSRTSIMRFAMADVSLGCHIMTASEGTYVTAHRHGAGAHVMIVGGQGYENLFMPDEIHNRRKVPTVPYAVVAPKANEFHQHFNTGKGDYTMLAFRGGGGRYGSGRTYDPAAITQSKDPYATMGFMIPFDQEDPSIRAEYYQELEKNGVTLRLDPLDQGAG